MDSNFWYRGTKAADFRSVQGIAGVSAGLSATPPRSVGVELREIGVEDFAVDRQRHAFVDLVSEAGEAAVEFENQAADRVGPDLAQSGELSKLTDRLRC
jgi:hypothetical protein